MVRIFVPCLAQENLCLHYLYVYLALWYIGTFLYQELVLLLFIVNMEHNQLLPRQCHFVEVFQLSMDPK